MYRAVAILWCLASPVLAQSADSEASSESSSGVIIEGAQAPLIAPSVGAPGAMHTAPCIIGHSVGVSIAGFGASSGGGRIEESCLTRAESEFLFELLSMPPNVARQAAIYHACRNVETLRDTLVAIGACVVQGRE